MVNAQGVVYQNTNISNQYQVPYQGQGTNQYIDPNNNQNYQ